MFKNIIKTAPLYATIGIGLPFRMGEDHDTVSTKSKTATEYYNRQPGGKSETGMDRLYAMFSTE